ncbi:MAG: hypothetical protein HC936_16150 [Leptolyngbyaceae cyanobacterium SU_3_3]|nr:hypothetical protein [Leptolyngbyaceae cyanobacterium SU_3_3]
MPQFSLKLSLTFDRGFLQMRIWNLMRSKPVRGSVVHFVTASLVAIAMPVSPAKAEIFGGIFKNQPNPYLVCATDLTRAKIATTEAANACAQALRPQDLGTCVDRISTEKIPATDALAVCRRVRRPIEAGNCVVRIRQQATDAALVDVLDSCRRSLLPERYAECVVGLNRQLKIAGKEAIGTCLSASDRPNEVEPTFIPAGAPIPGATSPTPTPVVPSSSVPAPTPTATPMTPTATPMTPTATPIEQFQRCFRKFLAKK